MSDNIDYRLLEILQERASQDSMVKLRDVCVPMVLNLGMEIDDIVSHAEDPNKKLVAAEHPSDFCYDVIGFLQEVECVRKVKKIDAFYNAIHEKFALAFDDYEEQPSTNMFQYLHELAQNPERIAAIEEVYSGKFLYGDISNNFSDDIRDTAPDYPISDEELEETVQRMAQGFIDGAKGNGSEVLVPDSIKQMATGTLDEQQLIDDVDLLTYRHMAFEKDDVQDIASALQALDNYRLGSLDEFKANPDNEARLKLDSVVPPIEGLIGQAIARVGAGKMYVVPKTNSPTSAVNPEEDNVKTTHNKTDGKGSDEPAR